MTAISPRIAQTPGPDGPYIWVGESWAFFHTNTDSSTLDAPRSVAATLATELQNLEAAPPTQSQLSKPTVLSDDAIRAEIRGLQQQLDDRRRSLLPEIVVEEQILVSQQPNYLPPPPDSATITSNIDSSDPYRCWDSCCNGRTFSNKSNFARHQREKRRGRDAADLKCSFCGVGFTRATARHAHEAERRCRNSGGSASVAR